MPKFSIIIPVYKVEKYIRQCVESIVNQTFADFEAIFVDDCGGDNSINIIEEYANNDKRIKILKHDRNKGIAAARNTALDFSSGEYTVCIDADDWIEPKTLEILDKKFKGNNVNSVWFDANRYYEDTKTFEKESMLRCVGGFMTITPETICNYTELSWGKAYKTSTIKENNIRWPENIKYAEDANFYYTYFTYNPKVLIIEDRLYNYRVRANSAVRNAYQGNFDLNDLYNEIRVLNNFYISHNLYPKYKITMLKYMQKSIRIAVFDYKQYNASLPKIREIINEMKLTDNFKEFDVPLYPLVSVILPKNLDYNKILNCLKRIQSQSYKNIEILCPIDFRNKKLYKSLNSIFKKDSRIKYLDIKDNVKNYANGDFTIEIELTEKINYTTIQSMVHKYIENPVRIINKK